MKEGQRVLITDDLLATGGTIEATIELVEKLGGVVVGCAFLIELGYLDGMSKLKDYDVNINEIRINLFIWRIKVITCQKIKIIRLKI